MSKKISTICLIIILLILSLTFTKAEASNIQIGEKTNIVRDHCCDDLLQFRPETGNYPAFKDVQKVYYTDSTGTNYPAFCIEPGKDGVGSGAGDSYEITIEELNNPAIWRVLYKGYMNNFNKDTFTSNYQDFGLETDDDFYVATKTAVHSIVTGTNPTEIYQISDGLITSQNIINNIDLEEEQRRGQKVLDLAEELYNYGISGNDDYSKPDIRIKEEKCNIEEECSTQIIEISDKLGRDIKDFSVSLENYPENSKIEKISKNKIKIFIPLNLNSHQENTETIENTGTIENNKPNSFKGKINISNIEVKNYPVYLANPQNDYQKYAIMNIPYETTSISHEIEYIVQSLKILKINEETKEPVKGGEYTIYLDTNLDGKIGKEDEKIQTIETDENGEAIITNLKSGTYLIKETKAPNKYIIDKNIYTAKLYNLTQEEIVTITSKEEKEKYGRIKVIKIDGDTQVPLENITFEIRDEQDNLIQTLITDKNGEAISKELLIDKEYKIKETITNEEYILNEEEKTIKLEEEQIKEIKFENYKKPIPTPSPTPTPSIKIEYEKPKTGDNTNIAFLILLFIISSFALIYLIRKRIKKVA